MAGKWAEISKKLPRREEDPSPFRERVRVLKDQSRDLVLVDKEGRSGPLAAAYRAAREKKEGIETTLSAVNAEIQALEDLISEAFQATAREGPLYFPDGRRIEVSDQISVRSADPDAVSAWARENGFERFLAINAKRLEGIVKASLEEGQALPDGVLVSAYSQVKLAG